MGCTVGGTAIMSRMAELELTRSRDDRRLYEIVGVGTLRFRGLFSRHASAESGAGSWSFGAGHRSPLVER